MKKHLLFSPVLFLGIFLFSSCASTKLLKQQKRNKETVRLWFEEGWNNNRNKELIPEVFAVDWEDGNPILPDQTMGHEGLYHAINNYRAAFPDAKFDITHLFAEGNNVLIRYEVTATHMGEFFGAKPTERQITTTGMIIYEMENSKIKVSWAETDIMGLMNQIRQ